MDTLEQQEKWDARYRDAEAGDAVPARVLTGHDYLLPRQGRALDLACGLGGNALYLAARGLEVTAWDLSPVAVAKLDREARRRGLGVAVAVRDVAVQPPPPAGFDVIVVSHFLERALAPALVAALRPGGLLFYQTFTRERVDASGPPDGPYRLDCNELLRLFGGLRLVAYEEAGRIGDPTRGFRNEAMLVGQKAP